MAWVAPRNSMMASFLAGVLGLHWPLRGVWRLHHGLLALSPHRYRASINLIPKGKMEVQMKELGGSAPIPIQSAMSVLPALCRLGFLKPLLPSSDSRIGTSIFILSLDSPGSTKSRLHDLRGLRGRLNRENGISTFGTYLGNVHTYLGIGPFVSVASSPQRSLDVPRVGQWGKTRACSCRPLPN